MAGYILGRKPLALKSLAESIFNEKVIRLDELRAEGEGLETIPREKLVKYSAQDADLTLKLWNRFAPEVGVVR